MKISEMISELQRIHSILGDIDVVTQCKDADLCELNTYDCEIEMDVYEKKAFGPNELQRDFELSGSDKILVIE
jgi:hypothetical protein